MSVDVGSDNFKVQGSAVAVVSHTLGKNTYTVTVTISKADVSYTKVFLVP